MSPLCKSPEAATSRLRHWESKEGKPRRWLEGREHQNVGLSVPVSHGLCRDKEDGTDTFEENSHVSLLSDTVPVPHLKPVCLDLHRRGTFPVAGMLARAELGHFPLAVLVGTRRCSESPGQHWLPEQRIRLC